MTAPAVTGGPPATQAEKLTIYAASAVVAAVMGGMSFLVAPPPISCLTVPAPGRPAGQPPCGGRGGTTCQLNDGRDAGKRPAQPTSGGPWRTRAIASAGVPRHQPSASIHQVSPART